MRLLKTYLQMLLKALKIFFSDCWSDTKESSKDFWYELKSLIKAPWWFLSDARSTMFRLAKSLWSHLRTLSTFYKNKPKKRKSKR